MKAIETNQLIKKYTAGRQSVPVLKGIDLQISVGEFIAIETDDRRHGDT